MNTEQERADFEAWVKSLPRGRRYCLITYEHEGRRYYDDTYTSIAFEAFIAGRAALQSQDREDAQRYRWLRENWFTMGSTYKDDQIQFYINGPRYSNATEADLDAAIDHARRVEGEGE